MLNKELNLKNKYRHIYIIDSLSLWRNLDVDYEVNIDLVLTFDFELKKYIDEKGGNACYVDHLLSKEEMHKNNYAIYDYFNNWCYDKSGRDFFIYKGVPFGETLKLDFWNSYVSFCRIYLNFLALNEISFNKIICLSCDENIIKVLKILELNHEVRCRSNIDNKGFYFPISEWLDSKIAPSGMRAFLYALRQTVQNIYSFGVSFIDKLYDKNKKTIFIQEYFPTKKIISSLRENSRIKILLTNFTRGTKIIDKLKDRTILIKNLKQGYYQEANEILQNYRRHRDSDLCIFNSNNITPFIYSIIDNKIEKILPDRLKILDSCIDYLAKNNIELCVLISNIGSIASLFHMVCKVNKIPSYLIINGWLGPEYLNEAKDATFINSYSQSIKENYFQSAGNIVVLGDPRMDDYYNIEFNSINRILPTIVIGASGFNPMDLNSYLAVEFDFLNDILETLEKGEIPFKQVIIKVRANGYKQQYLDFVNKFYPNIKVKVVDKIKMLDVLRKADLYISIYSQTLFEASCLNIPVIYYKNDTQILPPPFDNNSELVTASNSVELSKALKDFVNNDSKYETFLNREVMEKYMGFLDGKNLNRNIDYIYDLIGDNNV